MVGAIVHDNFVIVTSSVKSTLSVMFTWRNIALLSPPSLPNGAPVHGTHPDGVHMVADPIADDPVSEFPSETSNEPRSRIIEIIPAKFLSNARTAPPPDATTNPQHRSPLSISDLMAAITFVGRSALRMIGSIYLTTQTRGSRATAHIRAVAVNVWAQLRRLRGITATPDESGVAQVRRGDAAFWVATVRHTLAMKLPAWSVQTRRNHSLTSKSALLAFFGGITVGAAIMWSFDLQSPMNGFRAEKTMLSSMPPVAKALNLSRQDLPLHPTSLAASVVSTPTPRVTSTTIPTAGGQRRPTMTRRVAVSNKPAVSGRVAASSPTPRFRGTLAIDSLVPGARVFINGQPVGVTPLLLKDVPAGSRAVRVEATGYGTWSASLQVTANQQTRVMAKLNRVIAAVSK